MEAKGLSNRYLEKIGRKILPKSFLGVYPSDIFPDVRSRSNFSIIFNTGTSYSKGEHFVAVFVKNNEVLYFDSFGEPLRNKYIKNFLLELSNNYHMFNTKLQDDRSNFCGFYCLAFLLNEYKTGKTQKFISLFRQNNNLLLNDKKVVKFILKQM
jgi:hypothetical protein